MVLHKTVNTGNKKGAEFKYCMKYNITVNLHGDELLDSTSTNLQAVLLQYPKCTNPQNYPGSSD